MIISLIMMSVTMFPEELVTMWGAALSLLAPAPVTRKSLTAPGSPRPRLFLFSPGVLTTENTHSTTIRNWNVKERRDEDPCWWWWLIRALTFPSGSRIMIQRDVTRQTNICLPQVSLISKIFERVINVKESGWRLGSDWRLKAPLGHRRYSPAPGMVTLPSAILRVFASWWPDPSPHWGSLQVTIMSTHSLIIPTQRKIPNSVVPKP